MLFFFSKCATAARIRRLGGGAIASFVLAACAPDASTNAAESSGLARPDVDAAESAIDDSRADASCAETQACEANVAPGGESQSTVGKDIADAPSDAAAGPPGPADFDCHAYVEIDQLRPATCAVVDPVSHRVGHLEWICAGGAARLELGNLELTGSVQGNVVDVAACREDPVSWLSGHYETVRVSANLVTSSGALSFARASGLSCASVFTDCGATASVTLKSW